MTAYATPDDAARIRASGFRAHLTKPVDPAVVVETVLDALSSDDDGQEPA